MQSGIDCVLARLNFLSTDYAEIYNNIISMINSGGMGELNARVRNCQRWELSSDDNPDFEKSRAATSSWRIHMMHLLFILASLIRESELFIKYDETTESRIYRLPVCVTHDTWYYFVFELDCSNRMNSASCRQNRFAYYFTIDDDFIRLLQSLRPLSSLIYIIIRYFFFFFFIYFSLFSSRRTD